jgi:hypothetical protein
LTDACQCPGTFERFDYLRKVARNEPKARNDGAGMHPNGKKLPQDSDGCGLERWDCHTQEKINGG